jgi:hypothetical protein
MQRAEKPRMGISLPTTYPHRARTSGQINSRGTWISSLSNHTAFPLLTGSGRSVSIHHFKEMINCFESPGGNSVSGATKPLDPHEARGAHRSRGACFRGAEPGLMAQSSARRIAGHRLAAGGVRRRTSLGDILLHVLPKVRGQQYRVRWDVRARLTRGLEAPIDHRPLTRHPPPTTGYQSPTPFSSFRVPQGGISD